MDCRDIRRKGFYVFILFYLFAAVASNQDYPLLRDSYPSSSNSIKSQSEESEPSIVPNEKNSNEDLESKLIHDNVSGKASVI